MGCAWCLKVVNVVWGVKKYSYSFYGVGYGK